MRYRFRTLWILAWGNLIVFGAISAMAFARSSSLWPFVDCVSLGQAAVLGAVAALLPSRQFIGLGSIILTAIVQAGTIWLIQRSFNNDLWPMRSALFYAAHALLVAVVLMGFRSIGGWRLAFDEPDVIRQAGQFSLGQCVEWMTCVAALLGLFSAMRQAGMILSLIDVATIFPWPVLVAVPAVRIVLSRSPTIAMVLLLAAWSVSVCFASWMTDLRYVRFMALLTTWKLSLTFSGLFLIALFGNLLILRWVGLRWYAPTRHPRLPAVTV